MAAPRLEEQFATFGLAQSASLDQVDNQYFTLTNDLLKVKSADPVHAAREQKKLDENYAILLRYFISKQPFPKRTDLDCYDLARRKWTTSTRGFEQHPYLESEATQETAVDDYMLKRHRGDILQDALEHAVIIHATNCLGDWGAGFAADLKKMYPAAFHVYREFCCRGMDTSEVVPLGRCLLIDPQKEDQPAGLNRYIACLFTSFGYGHRCNNNPGRSSREEILENTECALLDLVDQLKQRDLSVQDPSQRPGQLCSNQFNSGCFKVPWVMTRDMIEATLPGCTRPWTVYVLPRNDRPESKPVSYPLKANLMKGP